MSVLQCEVGSGYLVRFDIVFLLLGEGSYWSFNKDEIELKRLCAEKLAET
jgi:hypothetical protein